MNVQHTFLLLYSVFVRVFLQFQLKFENATLVIRKDVRIQPEKYVGKRNMHIINTVP